MPVSGEQTHKTWGVRQRNAIQPHSTWTDLEGVMLCDLSQSQRDKHRMIPPVRGPRGAEFAETGSRRRCQGRAVNGGSVPRAGAAAWGGARAGPGDGSGDRLPALRTCFRNGGTLRSR